MTDNPHREGATVLDAAPHRAARPETLPATILDLTGRTITTFIVYAIHEALIGLEVGERVEVITEPLPAIEADMGAWSRATGHAIVDRSDVRRGRRYVIEKGPPRRSGHKLAAIISDDGLFELLSPLGFALAAGLRGHDVSLYFQGPAVRVLAKGFTARMHGLGRPFSRFPRNGLHRVGHLPPQEKLAQLQELGARLFACGPSMDHYKVDPADLAFEVTVAAYLTFMEQLDSADIHLVV